jgi:cation:H+ antiporter
MIILSLGLFLVFLFVLIKCAGYSIRYSSRIARIMHFPEFIVSFFIVAFISVLPESTISIISSIEGQPSLGLGTLLGSNIADLTLVLGIVSLFACNGIKVESKILKNNFYYGILLLFPLLLGLDGRFSRIDGLILVLVGGLFFSKIYSESKKFRKKINHSKKEPVFKNVVLLVLSLGVLLVSAFYTVKFALQFANEINLPGVLIGLTIIAIGTCLPELIFSIRAVRKNHDELALGDILGTVITDATIILGIVILISPFSYNIFNLYILGTAMFLFGVIAILFMRTNKVLSKLEGLILILFYVIFISVEFFVNAI